MEKTFYIEDYHLSVDKDWSPALHQTIQAVNKYRNRWYRRLWRRWIKINVYLPRGTYNMSEAQEIQGKVNFIGETAK